MYKYFLYRYIDDITKEIVYIGKTQQLDVINRIDQPLHSFTIKMRPMTTEII